MKTIGIIGTRKRDTKEDLKLVEKEFLKVYEKGDTICSGLCKEGGDRFAVVFWAKYDTKKLWYPADWKRYGKGAGFVRNNDIAESSDILIACVIEDSKYKDGNYTGGTEDTIKKYLKLGKEELILV